MQSKLSTRGCRNLSGSQKIQANQRLAASNKAFNTDNFPLATLLRRDFSQRKIAV